MSLQKESEWESRWEKEIPCICSDFAQQEDVGCDAHGEASLLIRRFIKKEIEKAYNKGYSDREKEIAEEVEKILERHISWKPTEGYESEEECGFQKGLMAEAKLLKKDLLQIIKH